MKIYLASNYGRREELLGYAQELQEAGFEITSNWLYGTHQYAHKDADHEASPAAKAEWATEDLRDVQRADMVINFTGEAMSSRRRGGRHVEFGIGLALGKRLIIIGPKEHVFHELAERQYETWGQMNQELKRELVDMVARLNR